MRQVRKPLNELVDEFILYKRSLGYVYVTEEIYLSNFVAFVSRFNAKQNDVPDKLTVNAFLEVHKNTPGSLYGIVCTLREFSRHLILKGYSEAYVIPPKTVVQPIAEPPYFFTSEEISCFFEKLDGVQPHLSFKGRDLVLPMLFRLLYCCGLRCKEALLLTCDHVGLENCYLDINQSKGPKSRRIFISSELAQYMKTYDARISILFPERIYFFPNDHGHYKGSFISNNFWRFWKKAYPDFPKGSRPRAYDLRHHFAWANLNGWAAEGLDINVLLPYLMRYMGHKHIKETLYYFHFVPEFFPVYNNLVVGTDSVLPEVPYEE
jgi:integrase